MRIWYLIALLLITMLTGCQATQFRETHLEGNLLLWHSWGEDDALVLEEVLEQIPEISPTTRVISMYVPADELRERYITATQQDVGPDLLIGPSEWMHELADAKVVRAIDPAEYGRNNYLPATLAAMYYQDNYYGFPLSVFPAALYYNRNLTQNAPTTLEGLLQNADDGENIAFVPRFQPAYWGIQPFGAGLFDATGRFTLAESGFTEWLSWLVEVSHLPGVILNPDALALQETFVEGRVAYYVAGPETLGPMQETMGEGAVGIAPLPSGPAGASGPLLPVEAVMLGAASSDEQTATALAVARILTNPRQSMTFMRDLGFIPANQDVVVDRRIYPTLSGFSRQARTAVVLPNDLFHEAFYALGDRAYANVLAGILTPEEAVCEFGLAVIELQGYAKEEVVLPPNCPPPASTE